MKNILFAVILLLLPAAIFGQNINGRVSAAVYSLERYNTANESETYFRNFETLQLNVNESKFSLRTRMSFASNLSNTMENDPRVRFYNLYLEGRDLFNVATIKIGRQPFFGGLAGGIYDAANLKLAYQGYSLSGFYGLNTPAYQKLEFSDDFENDYLLGATFKFTAVENFMFALNYVDKNFAQHDYIVERMDEELNPINLLIKTKSNQYKYASAEASYEMENIFRADVEYEYDINLLETAQVEFNGRYDQIDRIGVNVYYNYREPRVRYNSIFSVFDYGNTQEIEGGFDYQFNEAVTGFAKYGYVTYKDDNSSRLTVGANTNYGSLSYRKTFGYAGELDAVSVYTARSFFEGKLTPSAGATYTSYKLTEESERNTLAAIIGGVNYRPFKFISFDIQGQYLNNKIYDNDFRVLFKLNYWFNKNLNLM